LEKKGKGLITSEGPPRGRMVSVERSPDRGGRNALEGREHIKKKKVTVYTKAQSRAT